jgi:hypothetical protein
MIAFREFVGDSWMGTTIGQEGNEMKNILFPILSVLLIPALSFNYFDRIFEASILC